MKKSLKSLIWWLISKEFLLLSSSLKIVEKFLLLIVLSTSLETILSLSLQKKNFRRFISINIIFINVFRKIINIIFIKFFRRIINIIFIKIFRKIINIIFIKIFRKIIIIFIRKIIIRIISIIINAI